MTAGTVRCSHPVRLGLKISNNAPIASFRKVWRIADASGFDHVWGFDHLAMLGADGHDRVVFDGWALLAAMAEVTERARIGLIVTGMVYRHPALLAKSAVTVDHLSGGRLEFGIGAAWAELEHDMFGIDTAHQVGRLSEGLQVLKALWTEERSSFQGRYFQLRNAVATPKPLQRPHPPIWIGAGGPQMLRLAARHADVWNPAEGEFEAAVLAGGRLRSLCRQIGRDPDEIRWSAQVIFDGADPGEALRQLRRWYRSGFTELIVSCAGDDPARSAEIAAQELLPVVRRFASER